MSRRTTFFTVDRKLLESELWLSEPFTKGQAWVDLIGRASYEDGDLTKRGQLLISERDLAKRWKWTRGRVRWFLQGLEKNGMIARTSQRTTSQPTQGTTLTIENYDKYQSAQPKERPKAQPTAQPIYNNINNITNLSLMQTDREDLEEEFGAERLDDLLEDVRIWAETTGAEVGSLPARIRQFARRQERDAQAQGAKPRAAASRESRAIARFLAEGDDE